MTQRERLFCETIRKINTNKRLFILSIVLLYILMFCLNYFTIYVTDDYDYMYSLADGSRITNITQIFSSLYVHAMTKNGRLVAHFFAYFFLMLPPVCFDVTNAFMFTVLVLLLYRYAKPRSGCNVVLFWITFAAICFSTGVFGQVYLWLDGSCNYLWAVVVMLLYLSPFIRILKNEDIIFKRWMRIVFPIVGLFVGAWQETASFGVLFFIVITLFVRKTIYKKKIIPWMLISAVLIALGWALMTFSPGSLLNKAAEVNIDVYMNNFVKVATKFRDEQKAPLLVFFYYFLAPYFFSMRKRVFYAHLCVFYRVW